MRIFSVVGLGALLLGGCSTTPYQRLTGPVPIAQGRAADFAALVPQSTSPTRCEVRESDEGARGGRAITLVHDEPAPERITVLVDSEGVPVRYIDARGGVPTSGEDIGDRTTIGLYLTAGYAIVGNHSAGQEAEVLEIPLAEATESQNLGSPGEMLEQVLSLCGGAI